MSISHIGYPFSILRNSTEKKKGAKNVLMKLFYLQMRCLIFAAILTVALATFGKEQ